MKFLSSRALLWGAGIAVAATVAGLAGFSYLPRSNAASSGATTHAAQAVPVSVAVVEQRNVTTWDEFSGRLEAVERVEVRSRVAGAVQAVHFR